MNDTFRSPGLPAHHLCGEQPNENGLPPGGLDRPALPAAGSLPEEGWRFVVRNEVAIEDFHDGSLALLCEQLRLVQLNLLARDIVGRLDGRRTLLQVATALADAYEQPLEQVLQDVRDLMADLQAQGVVERREEEREVEMSEPKRYLRNPDVSCRVEGPDGALLFNPDTDDTMVLNLTGLVIWEALDRPCTPDEIIARLLERCDDVPADGVAGDVAEFLNALLPGGFVGEVTQ